jgi:hypothetical protein
MVFVWSISFKQVPCHVPALLCCFDFFLDDVDVFAQFVVCLSFLLFIFYFIPIFFFFFLLSFLCPPSPHLDTCAFPNRKGFSHTVHFFASRCGSTARGALAGYVPYRLWTAERWGGVIHVICCVKKHGVWHFLAVRGWGRDDGLVPCGVVKEHELKWKNLVCLVVFFISLTYFFC